MPHTKDANEMSGSRGEANFVWKCKNCKVCETHIKTPADSEGY